MQVTITYLEMLDARCFKPRFVERDGWQVRRAARAGTINRDYYRAVGADWTWTDRLSWSEAEWQAYVDQPGLETWVGYLDEEPVGYFELDPQEASGVEIAYFGLLPKFIGHGLGGVLLSEAVRRAWQIDARRVWVHTCTLDHPQALANYLARGFHVYATEQQPQQTFK